MVKFKIEKGVSRITRVKLQAAIEESIAADINLLCEWSNNEKNYVVNELLRFAMAQDTDFQAYKQSRDGHTVVPNRSSMRDASPTSLSSSRESKSRIESETTREQGR